MTDITSIIRSICFIHSDVRGHETYDISGTEASFEDGTVRFMFGRFSVRMVFRTNGSVMIDICYTENRNPEYCRENFYIDSIDEFFSESTIIRYMSR